MRLATLAYTKPDARYDVIEFEAPVFRERIITTMRRKNKISFNFSMFYVDAPLLLDILGKVALDHKTTKPEST